jgi:hypothetical protein
VEKTKEHSQDSNPLTSKPVADALPLYHEYLQLLRKGRYLVMFFAIFLKLRMPPEIILLSLLICKESKIISGKKWFCAQQFF